MVLIFNHRINSNAYKPSLISSMNREGRMKYICTINLDDNHKEEVFIFPKSVDHDCMAEVLFRIKDQTHGSWKRLHRQAVSAGFVSITDGSEYRCHGESITLSLKSRDCDSAILNAQ